MRTIAFFCFQSHDPCDRYVPPSRRGAGGMSDAQARVSGGDMMPDRR